MFGSYGLFKQGGDKALQSRDFFNYHGVDSVIIHAKILMDENVTHSFPCLPIFYRILFNKLWRQGTTGLTDHFKLSNACTSNKLILLKRFTAIDTGQERIQFDDRFKDMPGTLSMSFINQDLLTIHERPYIRCNALFG